VTSKAFSQFPTTFLFLDMVSISSAVVVFCARKPAEFKFSSTKVNENYLSLSCLVQQIINEDLLMICLSSILTQYRVIVT
jgi:hypothetical protein